MDSWYEKKDPLEIHYGGQVYRSPYKDGPSRFEEKDFMDAVDAGRRYSKSTKKKTKKAVDKSSHKRSRMKKSK